MDILNIKSESSEHFSDTKTLLFENLRDACEKDQSFKQLSEQNTLHTEYQVKETDQDGCYECDDCSKLFQAVELYEIHKYVHDPVRNCPYCSRSYKSVKPFSDHIEDHIKNHIRCEYCPKIFFMKKTYISHIAQHKKDDKLFVCEYCEKKFATKKQLRNHTRVHTNERPFKCDRCDKTFKQHGALQTHMNTHMEEKLFTCQTCQGTFATTSSLKRHEKRIHATGRTMVCKLCQEEFLNMDSFFQHRMEAHPDSVRYFRVCPICNEEFLSKGRYQSHRKIHKEKGELRDMSLAEAVIEEDIKDQELIVEGSKKQRCIMCGILVESSNYYAHQNEHLEMTSAEIKECEKTLKFGCKKCDAILSTKQNALKHMDLHLDKTYFCPMKGCIRKKSMTYMSYTKHRLNNHQNVKCRNCSKAFKGYLELKRHRRINSCNISSYKCKWCPLTFTNPKFLLMHHNTHKRVNVYNCHSCNKKFPRFYNFQKHMSVVHSERIEAANTSAFRVESTAPKELPQGKFYCGVCREVFHSTSDFEEHESFHFKSQFQCKKCKKCFIRQANYWYHVKNKLCSTWLGEAMLMDIKDFTCTICKKELVNLRNFVRHMTNVHSQANYDCRHCTKRLNSVEKFRSHLVAKHPNEKKYFCTLCEAAGFVTYREFIAHKRVHKQRRHIKQVLCRVTKENLENINTKMDVKQEFPLEEVDDTLTKINQDVGIRQEGIHLNDENLENYSMPIDIKKELHSDEETVIDVPENVTINENGEIQNC